VLTREEDDAQCYKGEKKKQTQNSEREISAGRKGVTGNQLCKNSGPNVTVGAAFPNGAHKIKKNQLDGQCQREVKRSKDGGRKRIGWFAGINKELQGGTKANLGT